MSTTSTGPAPRIDHVLIATVEPERELEEFRSLGLVVSPGMVFEDGVRNWVVPMKSGQYLELLTAAPDNESGSWIRECVDRGCRFAGWAVEVPAVEDVADRLGLPVTEGIRIEGQDGPSPWRTVGEAEMRSFLPFFITYAWTSDRGTPAFEENKAKWLREAPGEVTADCISSMTLVGDASELRSWVGTDLPVTVQAGDSPRLSAVKIMTSNGEVVIGELAAT